MAPVITRDIDFSKVSKRERYIAYAGNTEIGNIEKTGDSWRVNVGREGRVFTSSTSARAYVQGFYDATRDSETSQRIASEAGADEGQEDQGDEGADQTLASVGNTANLLPGDPDGDQPLPAPGHSDSQGGAVAAANTSGRRPRRSA